MVSKGRTALCAALLAAAGILWRGLLPAAPGVAGSSATWAATWAAAWAVDPRNPGPSLPPAGRSLFDFLTIRDEAGALTQRVPFPFSALLDEIDERLGRRPGEPSLLKKVLIPLGRSLQRQAADPEYFRYPRAVVAIDTETAGAGGMFLKDRLYLGYHEKARILEVISYNEAAGRFEFQIVRDYGAGGAARVVYANRAVCTACHQGGGPLFSRPLWDETNANPEIARLLAAERRDFHGFPVAQGVDVPAAFDAATDRANRIAVYQVLWREGCGGESVSALRCRSAAFVAALQHRLSGGVGHTATERFREDFLATARRAWTARWSQGLAVPDPDIPNRDPMAPITRRSHVPARFDPLNPRPPLEVWTADGPDESGPARLIAGLAGFLSDEDVRRLDAALFDRGSRPGAIRESRKIPCTVSAQPRGDNGERLKVHCGAEAGPSLEGRIFLEGSRVTGGTIERLELAEGELRDLAVVAGTGGQREVEIAVARKLSGLHARRTDGNALETMRLAWAEDGSGQATVVFLSDFAAVETALEGAQNAFSSLPFRRTAVMGALFDGLGLGRLDCCLADDGMPAPVPETGRTASTASAADFAEPAVRDLFHYCARCHATPEASPPNFLYGDAQRVRTNIARCAERIFYRLDVWRLPATEWPKTPMPPVHALSSLGLAGGTDPALALIRQQAADLLRAETGREPRLAELEARGYESLRSCLAPAPPR